MSKPKNTAVAAEATVAAVTYSTNEQLVAGGFTTKSAQIRELHRQGMKTGDIARQLGVIYQHARNVINKPLKKVAAATAPVSGIPVEGTLAEVITE